MNCPVCGAGASRALARIEDIPVLCNVTHADPELARTTPRGVMDLVICESCTMIRNVAFDPSLLDYDRAYENSLHFSPTFQEYAESLAARLLATHGGTDLDILEVGCGKGEFLRLLLAGGANRCVGFDASFDPDVVDPTGGLVVHRQFDADAWSGSADIVVNRHVLEHLEGPVAFVRELGRALRDERASLYLEVPDGMWTLRDLGIWDLIYEHCSYFTAPALVTAVTRAGLLCRAVRTGYHGQFLSVDAARRASGPATDPAPGPAPEVATILAAAERFGAHLENKLAHWNRVLEDLLASSRRVAIWGAGSKGVSFLNMLRNGGAVDVVVDVNPRKVGRFVAGTGQRIRAPHELRDEPVDDVFIMNPIYEGEILAQLSALGCSAATYRV